MTTVKQSRQRGQIPFGEILLIIAVMYFVVSAIQVTFDVSDKDELGALLGALILFTIHIAFLWRTRRLTTRSSRLILVAIPLGVGLTAAVVLVVMTEPANALFVLLYVPVVMFFIWLSPLWALSIPCTLLSSLPLGLLYLYLAAGRFTMMQTGIHFSIIVASGLIFPRHRRLCFLWRPPSLPRLPRHRSGYTLIELLIVIAMSAILVAAFAHASSTLFTSLRLQEDWRQAIHLAEDEIALLRARESAPEAGVYPVSAELNDHYAFSDQAETVISPGPTPGLLEARVTVRLRDPGSQRDVSLTALLPSHSIRGVKP